MENLIPKWLYSHSHYHYLREALPKRAFYEYSPSGPNLVHKIRRYNRLYAEYRMVPPGDEPGERVSDEKARDQRGTLRTLRSRFTDLDVDVLDILFAIWLDRQRKIDNYVEIDTDEILHARGMKHKINGQRSNTNAIGRGYTPKQRKAVNQSICRLLLLWGDVKVIHSHSKEDFNEESRILQLDNASSEWSMAASRQFQDDDSKEHLNLKKRQSLSYRPGSIFRHFHLKQRMHQHPKIYNYNYRRYWREKRIGRYLMWQWRVNKKNGISKLIKSTSSLVNTIVLNLDQDRFDQNEKEGVFDINPKYRPEGDDLSYRTRERFERTLNRLSADDVIGKWDYHDGWKTGWTGKSNWTRLWLNSKIMFYPSESVISAYRSDDDTEQVDGSISMNEKSLSTLLMEVKEEHDLTQEELGEKIGGYHQSYVSSLINGKKTPSPATAQEIRDKLNSIDSK